MDNLPVADSPRSQLLEELMRDFAQRTGPDAGGPPRRYLWTDAFAVCNFLGLYRRHGEGLQLDLALRLVHQVHHVLGRHRPDDSRTGWISGLDEDEGERHPTRGGLRIGKEFPERGSREPYDPQAEWDRDGQYFHYLTQWMHALLRVSQETGDLRYLRWAGELALAAHAGFTLRAISGAPRLAWKMSIDLHRPLVPSMGHHDPLDALITYLELQDAGAETVGADLRAAIADADCMCAGASWATDDALGIGGLLLDATRLASLIARHGVERRDLWVQLLQESATSLRAFDRSDPLSLPPQHRLAFRELGLAIGLGAAELRKDLLATIDGAAAPALDVVLRHLPLAERIERTWADPRARASALWLAHRDINDVMLATSLAPEGLLGP